MLERLSVRGLGIIDAVEIELGPGFTAVTGETGAGKSLLVESLNLLAGSRASVDLVRSGDQRLSVEGRFSLPESPTFLSLLSELGVPAATELVIRREVTAAGRSRCWVNDVAVTAGALQRLAPYLLAVHGQHEQHGLADAEVQRRVVDRFGGLDESLARVEKAWSQWSEEAAEVARLRDARASRRDRLDAITFQLAEIDGLDPRPGENEELAGRRQQLRHAAQIQELSVQVIGGLGDRDGAAIEEIARSERALAEMASCGLETAEATTMLKEARVLVEEVLREVRVMTTGLREDPSELEEVESRLHGLERLMLKYGGSISEVLDFRSGLKAERSELMAVEDRLESAAERAVEALSVFDALATELQQQRSAAAGALVVSMATVLEQLEMAGTQLDFSWAARPEPSSPLYRNGVAVVFGPEGVEEGELFLAANQGEELRSMARVASGGELSRIHLAIRSVLRKQGPRGGLTLLFDEVDSGLGGRAAAALASLLADLATRDQVLVVTHLPQVAGRADEQVLVDKVVIDGRTITRVTPLEPEQRVREVARMIAGDTLTESALRHAQELLAT